MYAHRKCSPAWTAAYPQPPILGATVPAAWLAAYETAKAAGKIPGFKPSVLVNGNPVYEDKDGAGPEVCSSTVGCRGPIELEFWDAPNNTVGISYVFHLVCLNICAYIDVFLQFRRWPSPPGGQAL